MSKGSSKYFIGQRAAKAVLIMLMTGVFVVPVGAQEMSAGMEKGTPEDKMVIETEVGFDQVVEDENPKEILGIKEDNVFYKKEPTPPMPPSSDFRLKEDQVILLNQTLKKILEENEKLRKEKEDLDNNLKFLRGQRQIEINRMNKMTDEIKSIRDRTMAIVEENQGYATEVVKMKADMRSSTLKYERQLRELKEKMGGYMPEEEGAKPNEESLEEFKKKLTEKKKEAFDIVSLVDQLNKENDKLKQDAARIHYNMGNSFYHRGKYEMAIAEYKKALKIDPADANSHFNLAFISDEYMRDYRTALDHYQEYLFLRPDAEDASLVKGKIIAVTLELRSGINSPLEDGVHKEYRRALEKK